MAYFQTKKSELGYILEGLGLENVGIYLFYGHWEYISAILYILWPFGNLMVFFPLLVYFIKKKSGNPDVHRLS
jgi:hypothetical protein